MELVDGPSLADILAVEPVDPAFALDLVAQVADGLSAAHRAGLVHRDVKPGNILISPDGRIKVTDFGIAHAAGQAPITGPGLVMGTTQYMAPERIAGAPGTPASDLYALGIVLHECLTGVPPYAGSPAEVMAAHLYRPLPPLPSGVPPELNVLVARLTAKDPAMRISDAKDLTGQAAGLRDTIVTGGPQSAWSESGWANLGWSDSSLDSGGPTPVPGASLPTGPARNRPAPGTGAQAGANDPPGAHDPALRGRRRRAGLYAAGAALLAGAGVAGLLASGALWAAPTADRTAVGSSSTGPPAAGSLPSSSGSVPADGTGAGAGGTVGTGAVGTGAATRGASSPTGAASLGATRAGATGAGARPTATPSAQPTTGPTTGPSAGGGDASQTPGPSGSSSSTTGSSAPSSAPTVAPATTPPATSSPAPSSPAASTTPPVACVLQICL
jgi:eukaryotic-like serine/threonine-protein kinase